MEGQIMRMLGTNMGVIDGSLEAHSEKLNMIEGTWMAKYQVLN